MNGWQRLFVVISVVWMVFVALLGLDATNLDQVRYIVGLASIPPLVLYALGLALGWIWRGFRSSGQAPQR